jgi:protein-disulfide isomerase
MRSVLFERHREFGLVPWGNFAEQVGISDIRQFDACINDTRPVDRIERGKELADRMHIRGTPTIIVNGWQLPKAPSLEDFDRIVKNVLAGRPPTADMDS